jgi:hypothetical protein
MVIQVIQPRPPISVKWGLTGDEIRLASEAAHYLASLHLPLYWATVANHHAPERKLRELFRLFKSIIAKEQDRTGLPRCLYLEILEGRPTVHSNLLFPLRGRNTSKIVNRMMASERFPGDTLDIRPADSANAFVACHAKERTPQCPSGK